MQRMRVFVSIMLVGTFAWAANAQDGQQLARVSRHAVIPAMRDEWIALRKEYSAAAKKAGLSSTFVWQTVIGPTNEFAAVRFIDGLDDFDPDPDRPAAMSDAEWQNWVRRVDRCTARRTVLLYRDIPDVRIPHDIEEGRIVGLSTYIENEPNKGPDLVEFFRDEVLPVYEKAGYKGIFLARTVAGAQGRTFLFRRVARDFESLGSAWLWAPLVEALGEEKARPIINRGSAMIKSYETHGSVLRRDLGFEQE